MRTTVELEDHYRAKLLELSARRGEKGFSGLVNEAVGAYLEAVERQEEATRGALALRGGFSAEEAEAVRGALRKIRRSWR